MRRKTSNRSAPGAGALPAHDAKLSARSRVLLADDHPMTLAGVAQLIARQPHLELTGQARTPAEALALIEKQSLDLLITDMTMPSGGGIELIKNARALRPGLRVLVLSMHDEQVYAERALHAGARGYIMKEAGPEVLLQAIAQVLSGSLYVSPAMLDAILGRLSSKKAVASPISFLSDRELEIFELIGAGKGVREIAAELHLSPRTVESYRASIRVKLDCTDSHLLFRRAVLWVEQLGPGAKRSSE